ncbi:MAG: hypothetical protein M1827_006318 [Pycnora praestabilis]|nr:MAG: hypothetical protein M1827_006318 [Pycnora praestabilis]
MNDPSNGVPPQLLPHLHLISTYRYPILAHVSVDTVVEYLLQASKITRDVAAMNWTFLDAPADGTVLLAWQPELQMQNRFASDGYIWADPEDAFTFEVKGYTVEMYIHRSGFHPPNESIATHCRQRYRLQPLNNPNSSTPPCDPSLWIIHYSQADPQNRVPANRIPIQPQIKSTLASRQFLQSQGQLIRKEFMLHDRNNWPTINLPGGQMPSSFPQQGSTYSGSSLAQMGRGSQQAYFQHPQPGSVPGPSPAKRPRHTPPHHTPGASTGSANAVSAGPQKDLILEDEEGDLLDHLTPREISTMRYTQHHEWMEEVLSSPYSANQIVPVELGLGLRGELEGLTKGIFESSTSDAANSIDKPGSVGRMDVGKAEEFTKRATEKIAELNANMEKMKRQHTRRMAKFKRGTVVKEGERRLRNAVTDPLSTGMELWRFEGQFGASIETTDGEARETVTKAKEKVDDIIQEVEAALGKHIEVTENLICVQNGGLEEKAANNSNAHRDSTAGQGSANGMIGDGDTDMGNSAGGLLDQFGTPLIVTPAASQPAMEAMAQPPQSQGHSLVATPVANNDDNPGQASVEPRGGSQQMHLGDQNEDDLSVPQMPDVDMEAGEAEVSNDQAGTLREPEGGDWVIVNREVDVNSPHNMHVGDVISLNTGSPLQQTNDTPGTFLNTPGSGLPEYTSPVAIGNETSDGLEDNDFGDFSNLDSAGDALASYGDNDGAVGFNDNGGLDLDNSAFGDAFHGTEGHSAVDEGS